MNGCTSCHAYLLSWSQSNIKLVQYNSYRNDSLHQSKLITNTFTWASTEGNIPANMRQQVFVKSGMSCNTGCFADIMAEGIFCVVTRWNAQSTGFEVTVRCSQCKSYGQKACIQQTVCAWANLMQLCTAKWLAGQALPETHSYATEMT